MKTYLFIHRNTTFSSKNTSIVYLTFKKSETLQIFEIPYFENQSIREINNPSIINHLFQTFSNKSITELYIFEFSSIQKLIEFKITIEKCTSEYTKIPIPRLERNSTAVARRARITSAAHH